MVDIETGGLRGGGEDVCSNVFMCADSAAADVLFCTQCR